MESRPLGNQNSDTYKRVNLYASACLKWSNTVYGYT